MFLYEVGPCGITNLAVDGPCCVTALGEGHLGVVEGVQAAIQQ